MATTPDYAKISGFGDRVQILGLSSTFDTQALLNAELAILDLRKEPLQANLKEYNTDKESWTAFKTSVSNFNNIIEDLTKLNSSNKEVKSSNTVISATATSSAVDTEYSIEVHSLASKHRVSSDKFSGNSIGLNEIVQINGVDLEVKEDMSLTDLAKVINDNEDFKTNAVVLDGRLVLTSKETGSDNTIQLSNSEVFNTLGLTSNGVIKNELQAAKNATFSINGIELTSPTNSYKEIEGLDISFTGVTSEPAELAVERTADQLVEKVSGFVKAYNQMIENLNFMNGKNGEMQGESLLRTMKAKMSSLFTSTSSMGKTLSSIGIKFSAGNNGTIELDEEKLRESFKTDPANINALLTGENGFATKLLAYNETFTKETGLIANKIESLSKRIDNINKSIEKFDLQYERQTQILLTKYAAYETTMSSLNSQADMVKAMLGIKNDDD